MKIVFKLTPGQELIAAAIARSAELAPRDEGRYVDCGNVGGPVLDTGFGVQQQLLNWNGHFLIWDGSRTTLNAGASEPLKKIFKIFGGLDQAASAILDLETTDHFGLAWHETTAQAVGRLGDSQLFELVKTAKPTTGYAAKEEARRRYPRLVEHAATKSQAWLDQCYTKPQQRLAKWIAA